MRILAVLPENELAPEALKHVFRRSLRCGGMVPGKISNAVLAKGISLYEGSLIIGAKAMSNE